MAGSARSSRLLVPALAILLVMSLAGVVVGLGVRSAPSGPPASDAALGPAGTDADDGRTDPAELGTLALRGEWFLLRVENAFLDAGEDGTRERNDRRLALILRELNRRGV